MSNCCTCAGYHEMNLDWLISEIKKALSEWDVTKHEWEETKQYITDYFKNLDVQNEIDNIIERMLQDGTLAEIINSTIFEKTNLNEQSNYLTVGHKGCNFTNINDAINYAKNYCTETNRVTILIMPGEYNEEIHLLPNPGIDFIGMGNVTITGSYEYPWCPMYIVGTTKIININLINTSSNSYAYHFEAQAVGDIDGGSIEFINCTFRSSGLSAIGIGTGKNTSIIFKNCLLYGGTYGIYCHNYNEQAAGQSVSFLNCGIYSGDSEKNISVHIENIRRIQNNDGQSRLALNFAGSHTTGFTEYKYDSVTIYSYVPNNDDIYLTYDSITNGVNGCDITKKEIISYILAYCILAAGKSSCSIPVSVQVNAYNWEIYTAINSSGEDVKNECSLRSPTKDIIVDCTNEKVLSDRVLYVSVIGHPK